MSQHRYVLLISYGLSIEDAIEPVPLLELEAALCLPDLRDEYFLGEGFENGD